MTGLRARRFWAGTLTYAAIVVGTLVLLDVALIGLGLFPPVSNPGDPDLGWRPSDATGRFEVGRCTEFSTGETISYGRNEDGVRTALSRASINSDSTHVRIAVTGDSQTDLCAPNPETHAGVLESELVSDGVPAVVLAYGSGRYSPLQDYLAFRKILRPYHPAALVMNVYTGNDFQDILRVDDRPHFVPADSGYTIADPVWYLLDDPRTRLRSRVLFALRSVEDRLGIRRLYLRTKELRQLAAAQGKGLPTVYAYMKDLWKAKERTVGYSDALAAQMLGQQLFFHHLPGSREESLRRLRALMTLIRRENPGLILVMSPLPSYELLQQQPVDSALLRALRRLPITYEEGVRQEGALYESLRTLAGEQGWLFVDNLAALKTYRGSERLYNGFDYHLLPVASALIGRAQAAALRDHLARAPGGAAH
jgi:hypothetical protein